MAATSHGRKRRRLYGLAGTASLLALCTPAFAQTITYPTGSTNASPIILTSNSTILQVVGAGPATQSGAISGAFGLTKAGSGTLIFTANNSYTGTTTVQNGGLQLGNNLSTGSIAGNAILSNGDSSLIFTTARSPMPAPSPARARCK